jgi:hypothetical protein
MLTRLDLADAIGELFTYGPTTKEELVQYAIDSSAPDAVLEALERLPERRFATMRELWPHLPELPTGV